MFNYTGMYRIIDVLRLRMYTKWGTHLGTALDLTTGIRFRNVIKYDLYNRQTDRHPQ